jgi:isopentenyl-diphosphate delta-isomerase
MKTLLSIIIYLGIFVDMEDYVILVDDNDNKIGIMPKMLAHEKALLHRAFSVFIFNDKNELMLQQRADHKYHSPRLWTNTCCSHQRENESNIEAGKRRLKEEMGFETDLEESISFIYTAPFDNGLTEHEFDHILIGRFNGKPRINPDEVLDWKWMTLEDIKEDMALHPEQYTAWFRIIFNKYYDFINVDHESNS